MENIDWSTAVSVCHRCGKTYPAVSSRSIGKPLATGVTLCSVCPACAISFTEWWSDIDEI